MGTLNIFHLLCCLLLIGWLYLQTKEKVVLKPPTHTGNTTRQTHTTSSVQSILKSTSALFSTRLLNRPSIVRLGWRRVVFETPISSKSPSVVSHRAPLCLPSLCLPPSLFPSSSSPLNFITFGQKGIYSPTKVIAPLMEWASYTIDSLKPCRIFLARMQCFLFTSSLCF